MDLYEVMRTTAAVREFTGDPLPDEVLHPILESARFASVYPLVWYILLASPTRSPSRPSYLWASRPSS